MTADLLRPISQIPDQPKPDLIFVVGTGVTIGAAGLPYATWSGLIGHDIEHLVKTEERKNLRGLAIMQSYCQGATLQDLPPRLFA